MRLFVFSWCVNVSLGVVGALAYSKMANSWFRTYSNTFWIIFGTSKNVSKLRPPAPYSLPNYFNQYKKIWMYFIIILFLWIRESKRLPFLETHVPACILLFNSRSFPPQHIPIPTLASGHPLFSWKSLDPRLLAAFSQVFAGAWL